MKNSDNIFICGGTANAGPITKECMESWRGSSPCFHTFILCAIQTLELALNFAPCTRPESEIQEVINQLKQQL